MKLEIFLLLLPEAVHIHEKIFCEKFQPSKFKVTRMLPVLQIQHRNCIRNFIKTGKDQAVPFGKKLSFLKFDHPKII